MAKIIHSTCDSTGTVVTCKGGKGGKGTKGGK